MAYPRFPEEAPYFTILTDVYSSKHEGQLFGITIDGVPITKGCAGAIFQQDKVYDFYIINLTTDDHPMHIHLVNFQVIKRFKFNDT